MTPSIVEPTAPVAPTTATLMRAHAPAGARRHVLGLHRVPAELEGGVQRAHRVPTSSSRMTHEILIGEVEIISMFTPASPSTVNAFAATPGWLFIPAPTSETLPIAVVGCDRRRTRARP